MHCNKTNFYSVLFFRLLYFMYNLCDFIFVIYYMY